MSVFEMYPVGTKDIDLMDELNGQLVEIAKDIARRHGFRGLFDGSAQELSGILREVAWRQAESWGWLPENNPRLGVLAANHRLLTIMKLGAAVDCKAKGMLEDALRHERAIAYLEARHGKWLTSGEEAIAALWEWAPHVTSLRNQVVLERVARSLFG